MTNRPDRDVGTEYDDEYATCKRTLAELRIYGEDLNPDEITAALGIESSSSQRKGGVSVNSLGLRRIHRIGLWALSSEYNVDSRDLRRHLDWLLDRIRPRSSKLAEIAAHQGFRIHVTCIWWSKTGEGGPTLGVRQMRDLVAMNLECQFEIGFYGEEPA